MTNSSEIERYYEKAQKAAENIIDSTSISGLRDNWEDFLYQYHMCMGRIIAAYQHDDETKKYGHQLNKKCDVKSKNYDKGLAYLREARNIMVHHIFPFAEDLEPALLEFGGPSGIAISEGSGKITLKNNTVNGKDCGDAQIDKFDGKTVTGEIEKPHLVQIRPAKLTLKTIVNKEKRDKSSGRPVTLEPPKEIFGLVIASADPRDFIKASSLALSKILEEFERRTK